MKTNQGKFSKILIYMALAFLSIFFLFPFYWLVTCVFKDNAEIMSRYMVWLPGKIRWENIINGWKALPPYTYNLFYFNTFILIAFRLVGTISSSTLAAYAFARINFKFRNIIFMIMLSTMMLPGEVTMIPKYLMWANLGFLNTYIPLIVPSFFADAFSIFLIRQFIAGIPYDLDEAATCDGCSKIGIFFRIILPLCKPVIFTLALFCFQGVYSEFFNPLIYLNSIKLYTVSLGLRLFVTNEGATKWGPVLAMVFVSMIPQVLVVIVAQKHLVQGISTSGLKA